MRAECTPLRRLRTGWEMKTSGGGLPLTYLEEIQPRLAATTVSALSSALGVSESYAANIGTGRRRPHPRHWEVLAKMVGVSAHLSNS
jgi:hypothetical protein